MGSVPPAGSGTEAKEHYMLSNKIPNALRDLGELYLGGLLDIVFIILNGLVVGMPHRGAQQVKTERKHVRIGRLSEHRILDIASDTLVCVPSYNIAHSGAIVEVRLPGLSRLP